MSEKMFLFFCRKIGSLKVDGREYAFCHPLSLEINENRELGVACTAVDDEGNFYNLWWLQLGCSYSDNWGKPLVKKIGKYQELPEKNIQKIKSYLDMINYYKLLNSRKKVNI